MDQIKNLEINYPPTLDVKVDLVDHISSLKGERNVWDQHSLFKWLIALWEFEIGLSVFQIDLFCLVIALSELEEKNTSLWSTESLTKINQLGVSSAGPFGEFSAVTFSPEHTLRRGVGGWLQGNETKLGLLPFYSCMNFFRDGWKQLLSKNVVSNHKTWVKALQNWPNLAV